MGNPTLFTDNNILCGFGVLFCFVFCLIVGGVIVKKGSWKLSSLISNDIAEKHERKYFNSNQCLTMHLNWRSYTFMTE